MKKTWRTSRWIAPAILVLAIAACDRSDRREAERDASRTMDRVEDSAKDLGDDVADATKDATRATGDAIATAGKATDAALELMDVKAALIADKRVDAGGINVDSDHSSKTITLKGHVPTAQQKTIAEQIAKDEAVGYRVHNELRVGN